MARRARPKFFEAKRKKLQGRADLRALIQPDPPKGRGSPKKDLSKNRFSFKVELEKNGEQDAKGH
ncbi:hypothetical protein PPO43_11205 [Saprospira sp. CCB-QB6]|nr:hypothetical protein [Saprospira sp. CCB-QB6]WCL83075.1 hypothetical protein PPO43_11205 [Saprospira sp. CCB-QB6]